MHVYAAAIFAEMFTDIIVSNITAHQHQTVEPDEVLDENGRFTFNVYLRCELSIDATAKTIQIEFYSWNVE